MKALPWVAAIVALVAVLWGGSESKRARRLEAELAGAVRVNAVLKAEVRRQHERWVRARADAEDAAADYRRLKRRTVVLPIEEVQPATTPELAAWRKDTVAEPGWVRVDTFRVASPVVRLLAACDRALLACEARAIEAESLAALERARADTNAAALQRAAKLAKPRKFLGFLPEPVCLAGIGATAPLHGGTVNFGVTAACGFRMF